MRMKVATTTLLATASLAHAQQGGAFSGLFASGFGQYTTGTSTQRDNGFVYTPPTAAAAPAAAVAAAPPGGEGASPPGGEGSDGSYGLSGGFGGGSIGYNAQLPNNILIGIAGDIGGGYASGSSPSCGAPLAHNCGTQVDAISDVRGRIGYTFGNLLAFASGGLAVDHLKAYDTLFGSNGSSWRAGFVVGGGFEYKLTPNLSLGIEYLHREINSAVLFSIVPGVPERISVRSETARVSVNYYLTSSAPAPVVSRY